MICPKCKAENEDGAIFCSKCGKKLKNKDLKQRIYRCRKCLTEISDPSIDVCPTCGHKIPCKKDVIKEIITSLLLIAILVAIAVICIMANIETPKDKFYRGREMLLADQDGAIELIEKAAKKGNLEAIEYLADEYHYGWDVEQDYDKALMWYEKASDLGSAKGMNGLADMYREGLGVEVDYNKALMWYEKATELDYASAFASLGEMYYKGQGVEADEEKSTELYMRAAELGDIGAEIYLSMTKQWETAVTEAFESDCRWLGYIKHGVNEGNSPLTSVCVKQGDWVYFISGSKLYKQNADGQTYLIDDKGNPTDINSLNICGDYLYYRSYENGGTSIVKIRTDGKERTIIADDVYDEYAGGESFVCDYNFKSVFYVSEGYVNSSTKCPVYKKYSLKSQDTVCEMIPDDYDGNSISKIEIVGMLDGRLLAVERYGSKVLFANLDINSLTGSRVELPSDTDYGLFAYNKTSFYSTSEKGWGSNAVDAVTLSTMQLTEDVTSVDSTNYLLASFEYGENQYLVFRNMWALDTSDFPETYGVHLNDDTAYHGSAIDGILYYNIYGDERIFKVDLVSKEFEILFDPQTTEVLQIGGE